MTDEQVSTKMDASSYLWRQTESRTDTDAFEVLLTSLKNTMPNTSILVDRQSLDMSGWGNRTPTRDVGLGATHHTPLPENAPDTTFINALSTLKSRPLYLIQPENAPDTTFIDAPVDWTYDMVVRQPHHDVEAITRMDDKEVIDKLVVSGFAGVAERLTYLYDVTEEDEEAIRLDSLRGFAALMIKNRGIHLPQITVTDDGLIQAVWKHPRQGTLVMDFQESGDVEFTLLYGRWDQGTKRRRLSGELHPDQAILHVDHFVRDVMET